MGVVSVTEIPTGRRHRFGWPDVREHTRKYRVVTDSDLISGVVVGLTSGIPAPGEIYATDTEYDVQSFVTNVTPEQDAQDARLWTVTVEYSNSTAQTASPSPGSSGPGQGGNSPQNRPTDPTQKPVEWQITFVKAKKAVYQDLDGVDVKNSAKYFYNPAYERDVKMISIRATKNYATLTVDQITNYFEKINTDAWYGFNPQTIKIDAIEMSSQYDNGVSYVRATWTFLYNPDKWNPTKILDRGPYYLDAAGKPAIFVDNVAGVPLAEGLLDGVGGALAVGAAPVYKSFRFHNEKSFANIP